MSSTPDNAGPTQEGKIIQYRDQQNLFGKKPESNCFQLCGPYTTTQLCCYSTKVAETMGKMNECG